MYLLHADERRDRLDRKLLVVAVEIGVVVVVVVVARQRRKGLVKAVDEWRWELGQEGLGGRS